MSRSRCNGQRGRPSLGEPSGARSALHPHPLGKRVGAAEPNAAPKLQGVAARQRVAECQVAALPQRRHAKPHPASPPLGATPRRAAFVWPAKTGLPRSPQRDRFSAKPLVHVSWPRYSKTSVRRGTDLRPRPPLSLAMCCRAIGPRSVALQTTRLALPGFGLGRPGRR